MYPKGIIYERGVSKRHGVIFLKAPFKARFLYGLGRGIGAGLVGFAIMAFVFTFGPVVKEEIAYKFNNRIDTSIEKVKADQAKDVQLEAASLGLDAYYSLYIPKIDAKSKIIPNVDPANRTEYLESLQEGVAHTKGTYFPGQNNLIYLFAHSTDSPLNFVRYNAVFYMIRKLEKDDKIIVYFADKKYEYQVTQKIIARGDDVSWLTKKYDSETLVLQTCDPPGTTWNRLLIVAKPIDSN
jgi:LPXTG-site transpeptidase (sortase) family protein